MFHYPPAQPPPVPFLPLGAMQDTSLLEQPCHASRSADGRMAERRVAGHRAELDLALGLMQKRLGAEQMVAKRGDIRQMPNRKSRKTLN